MDLNLGEVKILIKASDFDKAFKDVKAYFEDSENIRGCLECYFLYLQV